MPFKKFQILLIFVFCFFSCGLFAQTEVNKYLHEIQSVKSDTDKVRLSAKIGDYYKEASSFDSALYFYNAALRITKSPVTAKDIAGSISVIGAKYAASGVFDKAINCFVNSLLVAEKLQNKESIANNYVNIGNILAEQQEYNRALEFYYKSLKIFKETGDNEGIMDCCLNIGAVNKCLGNLDKAIEYLSFSLNIAKKNNNKYKMAFIYNNIGTAFLEQGESIYEHEIALAKLTQAEEYFLKALNIIKEQEKINEEYNTLIYIEATILNNLSIIYAKQNLSEKAINYAESSLRLSEKWGLLFVQSNVCNNLYEIYKNSGKYKRALEWHLLFKKINDSVFNIEKSREINELRIGFETERKQKKINEQKIKIELLQKSSEAEKYKRLGLILLIFTFVILSSGLFIFLRKKIQSDKQVYGYKMKYVEAYKLLAEKELCNQRLKSIHLQEELKLKSRELKYKDQEITNLALQISRKNDFLNKIKTKLKKSADLTERKKSISFINSNLITLGKEKREFSAYIENINQSFFVKLRERLPDITKAEERLSVLLKLNLSTKEISSILNITAKSVENSRYRLRKRLALNKDEHMVDFLKNM